MSKKYPLGTVRVPRSRMQRLIAFLRFLGWAVVVIAVVAGLLFFVQATWHPFDSLLGQLTTDLSEVDSALSQNAIGGISLGSFAMVLVVAAVPLLGKGVRRRQYALSYWRGLLSSAIFLASDSMYQFVRSKGVLYFSATILIFLAGTIVLVEVVSRVGHRETESDTRTELLASIVSGLSFGLIVQFGQFLLAWAKTYFGMG